MTPEHHKVLVVKITEVKPHPNADRLEIIPVGGYQAISAKGQFKVGDLAYYVPPDSIVPETAAFEFLWLPNTYEGGVPERKRRIAAKRLRKEWSEGLLMPLPAGLPNGPLQVGDDLTARLGITHYQPGEEDSSQKSTGQKVYPRSIRGWIGFIRNWIAGERRELGPAIPTYDVKAFKNFSGVFAEGEEVLVTEKIHGCNARFAYEELRYGKLRSFFQWRSPGFKFFVGSRNLWKARSSGCVWREAAKQNPWIQSWCEAHPRHALYGEVVSTSTQEGFAYGCEADEVNFYLFDVLKPDGTWCGVNEAQNLFSGYPYHFITVPVLYRGPFDLTKILKLVDGPSKVEGAKHIREGVVVKSLVERLVPGMGRLQLKLVSNAYYEKRQSIEDEQLKEAA